MTDKRFKETISTGIVTDTITGKEYNCEMRIDDELLEFLNKLSDENEQLKKEIKGFESCSHNFGLLYDEAKNKVEELSKENKELKAELLEVIDASSNNRPNKKGFMGNGRFA